MNTYCNINETMLSEVYGGNSGGAAVVAALGCAAVDVKVMKVLLSAQRVKFMKNWAFI
ncbi:blpN protein [Streptococcus pneumoniae]|nr:blpN protein [Streptococcus pneumoniae]SND58524.1 blpN protein [Streptococcus pneumoniae]SNH47114.1 blpN protein [Streptococcus pneumoniae]